MGAGISGLTTALKLEEAGFKDITIFEKNSFIGGLAASNIVNGYVFDLHGGHVFNSKHKEIKDWVFTILPEENWKLQPRVAKILYNGKIISYPFELSLWDIPENERIDCLVDYVMARNGPEPDNYHDWLRWYFGDSIALKYMIPYNEKIWASNLRLMGVDWVSGKMPLPDTRRVISSVIKKTSQEKDMPHSTFYYPLRGGIQSLVDAMARRLKGKILCSCECESLKKDNNKYVVNRQDNFDLVISTIPLKDLIKIIKRTTTAIPQDVITYSEKLNYNSVTTVLCECEPSDISWLYIPDKRLRTHRLVFQGNLSPFNCPAGRGSSVILEAVGQVSPEKLTNEIKKCEDMKQFKIGEIIASSFSEGYVLYGKNDLEYLKRINGYLDDIGIVRVGRFSEHKYLNMDICMKRAFEVADKISNTYR